MKPITWVMPLCLGLLGGIEVRAQFSVHHGAAVSPIGVARSSSFVRFAPHPAFNIHHHGPFQTYWYGFSYWGWGYPYLGSSAYFLDPIVLANELPVDIAPRQAEEEIPKGRLIIKRGKGDVALPGQEAGVFRPLQPDDRARALKQAPPEPRKVPEPPPPLPQDPRPPDPQRKAKEVPPAPDPVDSVSRGKKAFTDQKYGRAERYFLQAVKQESAPASVHFLLAQAQMTLDKYQEAAETILAGLRLQSDWPKSNFRPVELYGNHRADFKEQLEHLKELLDRKPSDPVLLNLYAYQLWFDGRVDEAKSFFQRAAEVSSDKTWLDLFFSDSPTN
jgi:tetratricopeptide (TPR) repeat protein